MSQKTKTALKPSKQNPLSLETVGGVYSHELFYATNLALNCAQRASIAHYTLTFGGMNLMKKKNRNIILIGMPGCGKSTVGVVLAKIMGYRFLDSDLLIQESEGRLLCDIIRTEGVDAFNCIENRVNSSIAAERTVIATGGSVVYGKEAMQHLSEIGAVVYIRLPYEEIEKRLGNLESRGVSMHKGQTLREIYDERVPLYESYADIIVDESGRGISETALYIRNMTEEYFRG